MKVLIVAEVDVDKMFGTSCGGAVPPDLRTETVEELVHSDLEMLKEQDG